jgi:3-oxoacyl-[acyl-carrier protein] reductase
MPLEGKVAFVSGASRPKGIGRAIALTLAKLGADVAVTGKSHFEGAVSVAEEIKQLCRNSVAIKMDATDYEDVKKGFAEVKQKLGAVTILINNAAQMGRFVPIHKIIIEEWDNEVKTCLNSAFYCIKEAWADMCANKWGRIVSITSVAGVMGGYGQTSYGAAKAGLIALAKSVALEGARFNITSNAVLVGVASTDSPLADEVRQKLENRIAMHRLAQPQEIASAVAYLVSDEAQYMTGAVMNMMGGLDLFVF